MDPPKPVAARQKEPKNDPVTTTAAGARIHGRDAGDAPVRASA